VNHKDKKMLDDSKGVQEILGPPQCAPKVMPKPSLSLPGITLYPAATNANFQTFWSGASRGSAAWGLKNNISCVM